MIMRKPQSISFEYALKQSGPVAFSTMVKPAGSMCNLDCNYCYYLDKSEQYAHNQPVMSESLLEEYIKQYITANDVPEVSFLWHGGEPLLLGIDFYKKALALQNKYALGKEINNSLQTNGILLTDEWADFFSENNFLIGISVDGPEDIHNSFRVNKAGKPTFKNVMNGLNILKKHNTHFNTLSVVNKVSEGRGLEVYQFLKSTGSHYMQFLPASEHIIERDGKRPLIVNPGTAGAVYAPWSVSSLAYGEFMFDIFKYWVKNDIGDYFVQLFDSTLAQHCNVAPGLCSMNDTCGEALVVEHNGDVYPCDHFVYPDFKLGNILESSLLDIYRSQKRFDFGLNKKNSLPAECKSCKYLSVCRGECPKHRFETSKLNDGNRNSLCEGFKFFFENSGPYMEYMRDLLIAGKSPQLVKYFTPKQ